MPSVLERLADIVAGVPPEQLPDEVVHEAGRRLLDAIGCMLGGSAAGPVRAAFDAVGTTAGPATLVGDGRRASVADAALANSTALRYLDYMDGHPGPYPCHPSLLVPAVLAAAESHRAGGRQLALAIALGYEVDIRMQLGSGDPDITAHGWSGSTNLAVAVPSAVAGIFGLSRDELVHALAIATVHGPTLGASGRGQMAPSKSCVDGMVAQSAITAALLARHGMRGKVTAFEGEDGFLNGVAGRFDEEVLLGPIDHFRILDAYTKQYNAVKCAQSAVGSVVALRESVAGRWDEVDRIILRLAERDWRNQSDDVEARRRPGNRDTANHSVVYCLAAAAIDGHLQAEQFGPDRLADPRIHALIDRTVIAPDPELTSYWPKANPASVEIRLRSGETFTHTTIYFPGHPRNPIRDEELEAKFRSLATPVVGAERAGTIVEQVRRLPELTEVGGLLALLSPGSGVEA